MPDALSDERLAEIDEVLKSWTGIGPIPPINVYPVAVQVARDLRAEVTRLREVNDSMAAIHKSFYDQVQ